jgi:hypothetical protein
LRPFEDELQQEEGHSDAQISIAVGCHYRVTIRSVPGYASTADDEKQILDGIYRWQEAWNNHDAKAGATLFSEDADFVNVNASFWKGRQAIEDNHARLFAGMFKESTF